MISFSKEVYSNFFNSGLFHQLHPKIVAKLLTNNSCEKVIENVLTSEPDTKKILADDFNDLYNSLYALQELKAFNLLLWLTQNGAHLGTLKNVIQFLKQFPDNPFTADLLLKKWQTDPYQITEISGVGFLSADKIALKSGFKPDGDERLLAMAKEALKQSCDISGGGCKESLFHDTLEKICKTNPTPLTLQELKNRLFKTIQLAQDHKLARKLTDENNNVYFFTESLFQSEEACAKILLRLSEQNTNLKKPNNKTLESIQDKIKISLNEGQLQALDTVFNKKISLIVGKPGSGKTTLLKALTPIIQEQKNQILFLAPTGMAAKRISKAVGQTAKTIHRALCIDPAEFKKQNNAKQNIIGKIDADVVIVDESSMMDCFLFQNLLGALSPETSLILLGDPEQLPSVGPGRVLFDLIQSKTIPCAQLNKIERQKEDSNIIDTALSVSDGVFPKLDDLNENCIFLEHHNSTDIAQRIAKMLINNVSKKYNIYEEVQIICASKKGPTGSDALNLKFQELLNPQSPLKSQINLSKSSSSSIVLRTGDKVMHLTNDFDMELIALENDNPSAISKGVFNGDLGIIVDINPLKSIVKVRYDNGIATYNLKEAQKSLDLAYCCTVHKFQGSEAPVIFFIATKHTPTILASKNLVYTAITRAKNKCVIIGDPYFFERSVKIESSSKRSTRLCGLINGTITPSYADALEMSIFEQRSFNKKIPQKTPPPLKKTKAKSL